MQLLKDLGDLNYYLGVKAKVVDGKALRSQKKYICELLKVAGIENYRPAPTPMVSTTKLVTEGG